MDIKRIISAAIGLPLILLVLFIGNKYLMDIVISVTSIICLYEFYKAFSKKVKPIKWIGYVFAVSIMFIHLLPQNFLAEIYIGMLLLAILIAFIQCVVSKMKYNILDIAVTFIGIMYVVLSLSFISLISGMNNGNVYIWIVFIIPWMTDTFAYFIGKRIGKHKISTISPKKSWEGAIGGLLGAVIGMSIYLFIINRITQVEIHYISVIICTLLISIISQIGDFAASTIKRYVEVKDFGNLLPGHGGLLDRIDSIIFCAPFIYFILTLI
ncbi:MAG: phosphatidate cytidylyltransferase [Clostridia bacterium]|nr:phosphatidate cytidylyltransferase [Clostridia bacterium]